MLSQTVTAPSTSRMIPPSSSSIHLPSEPSASATLRSLYPRAARAFLQRDFALAHSLIESAGTLLTPPQGATAGGASAVDALTPHRRKWDVLRITLESTAYAAPPDNASDALPSALRANALLSAPPLLAQIHARSLRLHTPQPCARTAAYLPSQIITTLILAALKLECPDVARQMVEDWLACRAAGLVDIDPASLDGYEHVLEMYCVHVLPRLEEWDYAREFLKYEPELTPERKERLLEMLDTAQEQATAKQREATLSRSEPTPKPTPQRRSSSPSPSSGGSSASTASTHTARPTQRAELQPMSAITTSAPRPSSQKRRSPQASRRTSPAGSGLDKSRSASRSTAARAATDALPALPRAPAVLHVPVAAPTAVAAMGHALRGQLSRFFGQMRRSPVLAALFLLVPLLSFCLRVRRAGSILSRRSTKGPRRPLGAGFWRETVRAVADTIVMAGKGLV